jgi:hypothetical protein
MTAARLTGVLHYLRQSLADDRSDDELLRRFDPNSGLVILSIGSDAGLKKGHTLEVFRLGKQPKYLGWITIVEAAATAAVGIPTSRLTTPIEPGDRVANRIAGMK